MTISEQIREVALYSSNPHLGMPSGEFDACLDYRLPNHCQYLFDLSETDLRTYMLLVAEALE